jgi:hypothetical protein
MYRLGHQIKHKHWPYILIGVIVVAVSTTGLIWMPRTIMPNTRITQSKSIIRHVSSDADTTQRVSKAVFSFDLPTGWQAAATPQISPAPVYSWVGTTPNGAGRRLDVYLDQIPSSLAVNRLLPVLVNGDKLALVGSVSDNCINFTDKVTESAATGIAPAKWNNVSFLCDMGNYERDVVAIGSSAGVNDVTLTGPTMGSHRILLVYTDNDINPDFTILSAIVQSFEIR